MARKTKLPSQVLEKARALTDAPKKSSRPAMQKALLAAPKSAKEKVIAALKKLHPMD